MTKGIYRHGKSYRCRIWVDGKRKWKNLGDNYHLAIQAYAELTGDAGRTLSGVFAKYRREVLPKKAPKTAKLQAAQLDRLARVFGHMEPQEVTQPMVVQYLDMRDCVAGNREIALLRHVMTKCVHWGLIPYNHLRGMQYRHPETPRSRVVEPDELRWVMRRANPRERYLMWLIYLTGLRRDDALSLTRWNLKPDGVHLTEKKTGKRVRIAYTRSLERVLQRAQELSQSPTEFFTVSRSGLDSAWQRLRRKLKEEYGYELFQLKDLRAAHAAAVEAAGGDATRQLGHSSRALTQRHYLREGRQVTPIR